MLINNNLWLWLGLAKTIGGGLGLSDLPVCVRCDNQVVLVNIRYLKPDVGCWKSGRELQTDDHLVRILRLKQRPDADVSS